MQNYRNQSHKNHILHIYIYMKCPELAHLELAQCTVIVVMIVQYCEFTKRKLNCTIHIVKCMIYK